MLNFDPNGKPPVQPSPLTDEPSEVLTLGDDKELNKDEYGFILDTTLKPTHRKNEKILMFIDCFIRCKNINQAAQEVGVNASIGYQWRHKSDIANAIQKLIDTHAVKHGFDASEVVERAKEIMEFDPIELQNPDGTYKRNLHEVSPEARRALKKLKVKNIWGEDIDMNGVKKKIIVGEMIEYEFHDKMKALEMVGKEKDLFNPTKKVEHTISKDMASVLLGSLQRGQKAIENLKDKPIEVFPSKVTTVINDGEDDE